MGLPYPNADGELVKRCSICDEAKPATIDYFYPHKKTYDRLDTRCRICHNRTNMVKNRERRRDGSRIKEEVKASLGNRCQHPGCHMRYPEDHPLNFDLDHIDPKLKDEKCDETDLKWIAANEHEFRTRVVPNLQLLCCHHHRMRTGEQRTFGGEIYEMLYGPAAPSDLAISPHLSHPTLFD
jgi:hypothetical protein